MGGACCSKSKIKAQVHPCTVPVVPEAPASHQTASDSAGGGSDDSAAAATAARPAAAARTKPAPPRSRPSIIKVVKDGNLALVDELLVDGYGLETLGMWDNTPLLVACSYNHREVALRLIVIKADVFASNEHGATPLHYASVEGNLPVVDALIERARCTGGDADVQKLVNCRPAKVYNRQIDMYRKRTPLASAAESGFSDLVGVLLTCGADMEWADELGCTPLWLACSHSRGSTARLLLGSRADIGAKSSSGVSVLGAASVDCNEELVLALLAHGVGDVNDTTGSPLRDAVGAGKRAAVQALLEHGAELHPAPEDGGIVRPTPLHIACEKGDEVLVTVLVRAGADASICDSSGSNAFSVLRRRGLTAEQIAALLKPVGAVESGRVTAGTGEPSVS